MSMSGLDLIEEWSIQQGYWNIKCDVYERHVCEGFKIKPSEYDIDFAYGAYHRPRINIEHEGFFLTISLDVDGTLKCYPWHHIGHGAKPQKISLCDPKLFIVLKNFFHE